MFLQKQTNKNNASDCGSSILNDDTSSEIFDSEKTDTLSSPSQQLWLSSQEESEKNEDKNYLHDEIIMNEENHLENQQQQKCNTNKEISLLRMKCAEKFKDGFITSDVEKFKALCLEAGATKLFDVICETMRSDRQSEQRKNLNEKRAMTIICTMMYGQSQQANWYQVTLARALKGSGISNRGIETLRNKGVAARPTTVSNTTKKVSSTHLGSVNRFFEKAAENESMIAIFIDDHHNIHTHHRPSTTIHTQVVHMAT